MTTEEIERATPEEIVEAGIGLIARGLFRAAKTISPGEAADMGSAATSTVRSLWLDFEREASKVERSAR